jgi:excisionase family DNA binding protein
MASERNLRNRAVYTTGEAAEVCRLSQQTIIRCFDNGQLKGFRVPGSRFRRIPRRNLVEFMRANGIPLEGMGDDRVRVLVVDDDPDIIELFTDVLGADSRFEVATAQTGYAAGMMTQQLKPDVVVLDYMLPDVNGNVVCRTIRENPELAHIRILIISGMADRAEIDSLMAAGADDFIRKPFNIEKVTARISELAKG